MKKIFSLLTAAFLLSLGTAFAGDRGNGITDFSGKSCDTFEIGPASNSTAASEEAQDARIDPVFNGVTNFSGGSYDLFVIDSTKKEMNTAEATAAGGLRMEAPRAVPNNGITDFSGRARDTGEIDR